MRFVLLLGGVFVFAVLLVLLMHLVRAKSFFKKTKEFKRSQETSFCFIRQFSFSTGPNKLVLVRMYESTITGLVGPPYSY